MYISKEILNWNLQQESSTVYISDWDVPYEGWNHAENIISNYSDKFHRIDVIATLKRVIDYRVKDLSQTYNLKAINSELKKKNNYERLVYFNIIRPMMLEKLLEIRNNVEHKHEQPPSLNICKELVEFVWYFLKSTDPYCHSVLEEFSLNNESNPESKYGIVVTPEVQNNWKIQFRGWLTENDYSSSAKENFFIVNVANKETYKEFKNRTIDHLDSFVIEYHKDRADTDLYITEAFVEAAEVRDILIKRYFTANSN